jgi:transcriptional regulator with XRE-family HTH domain
LIQLKSPPNNEMRDNAPPEVGAALQRLRLARGLTLEDLSRIAGVSKSMLSQIEREKANPTIAITWRLANALGVQIGELLATAERETETIRVIDAHETPTLPGLHAATCCASWARWSWPVNMNGMN